MAEQAYFINDVEITAATIASFVRVMFGQGAVVAENSGSLKVTASQDDLSVSIADGAAFIQGRGYLNTASKSLSLAVASALPRIDRVIIRLDSSILGNYIRAMVLTGTPGANPVPPALTRSGNVYDISVAQVLVPANAVTPGAVTDERGDASVCGYAEGLFTLDLSDAEQRVQDLIDELRDQGYTPQADFDAVVDQSVKTDASPTFAGLTVTGGTIDGTAADAEKLGGVAASGYQLKIRYGNTVPQLAPGELFALI